MSGKSPKKEIQFERSLDRLEEIVKKLEGETYRSPMRSGCTKRELSYRMIV
jgi:hypothetical protein